MPGGSRHPIDLGAAACCDSGHKTLPVLTGGAYLHLGPKAPVQEESTVRSALALFGSTSPSYLILQSLDACNRLLSTDYRHACRSAVTGWPLCVPPRMRWLPHRARPCRWHWTVPPGNP